MAKETHYQTLDVNETATQAEIKRAYRRLAKQYHPDSQSDQASHDRIARINTAYEVIGDPSRRTVYDQQRQGVAAVDPVTSAANRAKRTADAQEAYRYAREATQSSEAREDAWLKLVYGPVDRLLGKIMSPLRAEIRKLSADPFDDELMEGFMAYLEQGRTWLGQAQGKFNSMANPASTAGVAADLYHCLGLLEDGLDELDRFTMSYEESYIHTGTELFRRVKQIRAEAKERVKRLV
ncbi:DnaJ domain-containing protein [Nodosilinea sp. LEGE 06152]|uniref:J domain-containing protein n=1 Tax=Nodosilinea sp. LEGE 06152 TaxID=2777966 RepID=UPI001882FF32|nr:DnaJ domain-containing protein [Nodosilinea sp. LEGE 06152]MBE9155245.1 DnaJ domain-containing protein [Nodosilinea sp. LEGE 06152]